MRSLQVLIRPWMRKRKLGLRFLEWCEELNLKNSSMKWTLSFCFLRCKLLLVRIINGYLKRSFWHASHDFKVFQTIRRWHKIHGRLGSFLSFYVFLSLPAQRVKLSEAPEHRNPWAILTRGTGLRFTVKQWWFNKFCCWFCRPGRHVQPGTAAQLTLGCHLNVYLKSQPPWMMRSWVNQLDSSTSSKSGPWHASVARCLTLPLIV